MLTLLTTLLLAILGSSFANYANPIACESNEFCEATLRKGSQCSDGFCTNPFQSGCLQSLGIEGYENTLRACNSNDSEDDYGKYCSPSGSTTGLSYDEIRILMMNWESTILEAWILQILLSEIFDVPASIEIGRNTESNEFYDRTSPFVYGTAYDYKAIENCATYEGNCSSIDRTKEPYESCGHVMLELWNGAYSPSVTELVLQNDADPSQSLGVVGEEHWFVPKFTLQRDNTLSSFHGLTGQENRQKLADRFLRPTRWGDYCKEVSENNCNDDGVAKRPPETPDEENLFFDENLYIGHFRRTADNDCVTFPDTCTGHFIDFPCGWKRFFLQQAYHLDIALKSNGEEDAGGYSYGEMVQIWRAANWTKSDAVGWWWRPESLYQEFQGTDAEFERINLPNPNSQCVNNRIEHENWCGDGDQTYDSAEGTCDNPPIPLQKLVSTGLYTLVHQEESEAKQSPAYDVISQFTISTYELEEIFSNWGATNTTDEFGYNARNAVCQWVGTNLKDLKERFILRGFPRITEQNENVKLFTIAIVAACIALASTLVALVATFIHRNKNAFRFAQIEFVFLLLFGLILVAIAAILSAVPPTNFTCVASVWFTYIGYTFEIGPLVVKIAAINKLMQGAKKMKRVQLSKKLLYGVVAGLVVFSTSYMTLWTIIDPPKSKGIYDLTGEQDEQGSAIVSVTQSCRGKNRGFYMGAAAIHFMFLLGASILAFMTRKLKNDLNETSTIAILVYWNFLCMILRIILLLLQNSIDENLRTVCSSLVLAVDVFAAILIYFVPKLFAKEKDNNNRAGQVLGRATPPTIHNPTTTGNRNYRATTTGMSTARATTMALAGKETSIDSSAGLSVSEAHRTA